MKFKYLAALVALLPLITFAAVSAQPQPPPQNYLEYDNAQWHFSIFIPADLTAAVTDDRGGTIIQFLDPRGNEQFQIAAWPYKDLTIHADGFQLRTPAENGDQGDELGTVGVVNDDLLEFLFKKNGITYDLQAMQEYATSTLDILKSWQFI